LEPGDLHEGLHVCVLPVALICITQLGQLLEDLVLYYKLFQVLYCGLIDRICVSRAVQVINHWPLCEHISQCRELKRLKVDDFRDHLTVLSKVLDKKNQLLRVVGAKVDVHLSVEHLEIAICPVGRAPFHLRL